MTGACGGGIGDLNEQTLSARLGKPLRIPSVESHKQQEASMILDLEAMEFVESPNIRHGIYNLYSFSHCNGRGLHILPTNCV